MASANTYNSICLKADPTLLRGLSIGMRGVLCCAYSAASGMLLHLLRQVLDRTIFTVVGIIAYLHGLVGQRLRTSGPHSYIKLNPPDRGQHLGQHFLHSGGENRAPRGCCILISSWPGPRFPHSQKPGYGDYRARSLGSRTQQKQCTVIPASEASDPAPTKPWYGWFPLR